MKVDEWKLFYRNWKLAQERGFFLPPEDLDFSKGIVVLAGELRKLGCIPEWDEGDAWIISIEGGRASLGYYEGGERFHVSRRLTEKETEKLVRELRSGRVRVFAQLDWWDEFT